VEQAQLRVFVIFVFDFYVKENRQKKKDFVITQIEDGQKRDPFWGVRASKYLVAWVG